MTLPELHQVIQAAMGWTDTHLQEFSVGTGHNAPTFMNDFDKSEGAPGLGEQGVRLDQVMREVGDKLTYVYDFGDYWRHRIKLEKVLSESPVAPTVTGGRRACPPEDIGGIWGYQEAVKLVEGGCRRTDLPPVFEALLTQAVPGGTSYCQLGFL
jgi:hypothetical protein